MRMRQVMRDAAMPIWSNSGQFPSAGCPLVFADHWKVTTLLLPARGA